MSVRVRIAPSPTGYMHVGNARTVLFNWLFARAHDGAFVWRVEDTDRQRLVEGALEDFGAGLRWLGIEPDEGPFQGGEHGPYVQSQRRERYASAAERLISVGAAYRCFCTAERLAEVREQRREAGLKGPYDGRCRQLEPADAERRAAKGEEHTVRLRMPSDGEIGFEDVVLGHVAFAAEDLYDIILLKSDGWPTYHLAVVVDDHQMAISHVIRADEWVSSTPYHMRLYEAFDWPPPVHAHVPIVLNPDGRGKLSKRRERSTEDGDEAEGQGVGMTRVHEYRAEGYLPEAMVNFLSLLGWSYSGDRDLFTMDEAAERFRLEDVSASPARWDPERLRAINAHYLRELPAPELAGRLVPFLVAAGYQDAAEDDQRLKAIVPLVRERLVVLKDIVTWAGFFYADAVAIDPVDLVPKKLSSAEVAVALAAVQESLVGLDSWDTDAIEAGLRGLAKERGIKLGPLLQPVRVAVTGSRVAPPLFETLAILGRDVSLERMAKARGRLRDWVAAGEPGAEG